MDTLNNTSATLLAVGIGGATFMGLSLADWTQVIGIIAGLLSITLSIRKLLKEKKSCLPP